MYVITLSKLFKNILIILKVYIILSTLMLNININSVDKNRTIDSIHSTIDRAVRHYVYVELCWDM